MIKVEARNLSNMKLSIAKSGYSLRGFAREAGISSSYLSQILNGYKKPSVVIAKKIATALDKDINEFFLIRLVDDQPKVFGEREEAFR